MKRVIFLLIALGLTAPAAQAVDEFATPRPSLNVKTKSTLATRAPEVYLLRAPDVVGQPVSSARAILEKGRLQVGRETAQVTSEHRPGTVMNQDPKPGTAMQPGASVNLWVATPPRAVPVPGRIPGGSDGVDVPTPAPQPHVVIVPNLVGQSLEVASVVLGKPGLSLGDRRRQESDAAAGTVIAQFPAAGTRVKPGTSVDVTIAAPALVAVPDLTGETPREAIRLLHRQQLSLGQERQRESEARPGTVIRQAPAPGTRVPRETPVNILVATAPPAPVPPPAPYTPPVPPRSQPLIVPPIVIPPQVVIRPTVPPIIVPPVVVAPTPPAPPAPVVVTPPPAPPVVTPPPTPAAVAVAPPAPAPVRKPAPKPVEPPKPVQPPPPAPPAPEARPAPVLPARESEEPRWPKAIVWGLGSVALLSAGGTAYYRVRMTNGAQPVAIAPTVTFAAHWDVGTQQIDAMAPLASSTGLRLVSGIEAASTTLETDHLVGAAHDTGGTR
jgi:beta-lactam-binding protein with PASTA domain